MKKMNNKTTTMEVEFRGPSPDELKLVASEDDIHHICEVFGALIVMEQMFDPLGKQGEESNFDVAVAVCRKNLDFVLKTICNGWKLNAVDTYFAADKILKNAIRHFKFETGVEEKETGQ